MKQFFMNGIFGFKSGSFMTPPVNIRLGWKCLTVTNTVAYYHPKLITAAKVLLYRGQSYKTFYGRKLRLFIISWSKPFQLSLMFVRKDRVENLKSASLG